jgi:chorismate synthase
MGRGKFLDKHGYVPPFQIFNEYMERLIAITNKYGLQPMMWSDMYFRVCNNTNTYYDESIVIPPEVAEKIPKEVELVFWHYGEKLNCDEYMLEKHQALGRKIIYAGGTWSWIGHFPEHNLAMYGMRFSLNACRKYGVRDHRGGGRSSARETAVRVCAGALAKLALKQLGIDVAAYTSQVGEIALAGDYTHYDLTLAETNPVRCPDVEVAAAMEQLILDVKREGDTVGGVVSCVIKGAPVGLGEPLYGKLSASLASAMLSINAAKGFEYGNGFAAAAGRGSQQNDIFYNDGNGIATRSNNSGGIQGGISNGNDIYFRVAFKPVATVLMEQPTVTKDGVGTTLLSRGRHDPCVVPRAVPVVEAMAALVVLDHYLLDRARRNLFS